MKKLAYINRNTPETGLDEIDFLTQEEVNEQEFATERPLERAPQFDQYADEGRIPVQAYFDAGWSVGCIECWRLSDDEDEGCDEYPLDPVEDIIIGAFNYFCCNACADSWLEKRRTLRSSIDS